MKKQLTILFFLSSLSLCSMAETVLNSNQNENISVAQNTWQYFEITATQDNMNISIQLSNLSSDIDLYIQKGSLPTLNNYSDRGIQQNTRIEHLTPILNAGETLFIGVYGYTQATAVLKAQYINDNNSNTITSETTQNFTIQQGEWKYYKAESNVQNNVATVSIPDMSDDVDLYISKTQYPTLDIYDQRSIQQATREEKLMETLNIGETLYIGVYGYHPATGELSFQDESILESENTKLIQQGRDLCLYGNNINGHCSEDEANTAYFISASANHNQLVKIDFTPNAEKVGPSIQLRDGNPFAQSFSNSPIYYIRYGDEKEIKFYYHLQPIDILTHTFNRPSYLFTYQSEITISDDGTTLVFKFSDVYNRELLPIPPMNKIDTYDISDPNNVTLISSVRP